MRNQFFAGSGFPLYENGRVRGSYPLHLFEHRFQGRTIAYHLFESALIITTFKSLESPHREPPGALLSALSLKSCSNTLEQNFIIERLGQEFRRSCS